MVTPLCTRGRRILYSRRTYCDGCRRGFNGFISTNTTPPKMRAAPTAARPERPSPTKKYDVIQATTGSSM